MSRTPLPALPALTARPGDRARRCNHLLVASEPLSGEDIWEEIPEGWMLSLDAGPADAPAPAPRRRSG